MHTSLIAAHTLGNKVAAGSINDRETVRDIYRRHLEELASPELVRAGLKTLEEHGSSPGSGGANCRQTDADGAHTPRFPGRVVEE